jgi:hypothetical protein
MIEIGPGKNTRAAIPEMPCPLLLMNTRPQNPCPGNIESKQYRDPSWDDQRKVTGMPRYLE